MAIITISRQIASYGDETALELAKSLGYEFIDKKDLEKDLIDRGISKESLAHYDERKPGFWASLSRNRDAYFDYLREIVYGYALKGNSIFIGRGGFALLRGIPGCYAVRLVASDDVRIARLMKEFDWPEKKARALMAESDANREGFHRCFFDMKPEDPTHYRLVINTDFATAHFAANIITYACKEAISPEEEREGLKRIAELLLGQRIVNRIAFKDELPIYFLDAEVSDTQIVLHGVADSVACIDRALKIAEDLAQGRSVSTQISIVNEYKPYP